MKIVQINSFSNGSTGSIMMNLHKSYLNNGFDSYVVWGRGRKSCNEHEIYLNDKIGIYSHALYSRLTGKTGFASVRSTEYLIKRLEKIKPDIIQLHNIHGYYINIEKLFNYIKNNNIRVIWTLHDCWSFTGHCAHFSDCKCDKWKKECYKCPQKKTYPKALIDNSKWNYNKKKNIFSEYKKIDIVTPSAWLANLVRESYLKKCKITTINNGIDLNKFKPIEENKLKFKTRYRIESKKIILGVASDWTEKKGLNTFVDLATKIPSDYIIVLVGLNKKQIKKISSNKILCLERTNSVDELVEIYNSAYLYLNLSREETFGLTSIEAIACGTPIIVSNYTALPEIVTKEIGKVLDSIDTDSIINAIISYNEENKRNEIANLAKIYSVERMCDTYINLIKEK